VKKGDIVYVVSNKKHDKKWLYGHVAGIDTLGLVPVRVLHKEPDENHVNEDGKEHKDRGKTLQHGLFSRVRLFEAGLALTLHAYILICSDHGPVLFFYRFDPKRT
jgi:hypothetical protein